MKLTTMFMIIVAIQINLLIFDTTAPAQTALFSFVNNPSGWSDSLFITLFGLSALALVGAASIGSIFFKSDIIVFAPLVAIIISWMIPITSLWNLIARESDLFGTANYLMASIITAPLVIISVFSVLAWWRGNTELA